MKKKLTAILVLIIMLVFSAIPAYADDFGYVDTQKTILYKSEKVIFKSEIEVTAKGGVYQVGFVTIKFPKNFIDEHQLPVRLNVEISASDGIPGIEFTPDLLEFNKPVTIIVHPYKGLLYDQSSETNIPIKIRNHKINVFHFSRYAFS